MLTPDNLVSHPHSSQGYNRYSYVLNNPLKYIDPTGNSDERATIEEEEEKRKAQEIRKEPPYIIRVIIAFFRGDPLPQHAPNLDKHDSNEEKNKVQNTTVRIVQNTAAPTVQSGPLPSGGQVIESRDEINSLVGGGDNSGDKYVTFPNREPYTGLIGTLDFVLSGGNENGIRYNINGEVVGLAPIMGIAPDFSRTGPAKGFAWLTKMTLKYPGSTTKITQVGGKFWKYSIDVMGNNNGRTVYTKIVNAKGSTVKWFHDTFDKSNKFLHRGWEDGGKKIKLWWNGRITYP